MKGRLRVVRLCSPQVADGGWRNLLRDEEAAAAIEYVVIGALLAALLVPILVAIFNTLKGKLEAIHDGL